MKRTIAFLMLLVISLGVSTTRVNYAIIDGNSISIDPPSIINPSLGPGSTITVNASATEVSGVFAWQVRLEYDPAILNCTGAVIPTGSIFRFDINPDPVIESAVGAVTLGSSKLFGSGVSGSGTLATFTLQVVGRGVSGLNYSKPQGADTFLLDSDLHDIQVSVSDGMFDNRAEEEVHDVAVTSVVPSSTAVNVGDTVSINVTTANHGTVTETFDLTAFATSSVIGTQTITLDSGQSKTVVFTWLTTAEGSFIIKATASTVTGETNTVDNTYIDGTVTVTSGEEVHDVAVTNVVPSSTVVNVGDTVSIDVTAANHGTVAETFDLTTFATSSVIGTQATTLDSGQSKTVAFTWLTTAEGNFIIKATASVVAGETNTGDNTYIDGTVTVTTTTPPPSGGDIEIYWANFSYGQYTSGDPRYPFGGEYHNGEYPVWKNFTVINGLKDKIVYIGVKYPSTSPEFAPCYYRIREFPTDHCWTITVNTEDRLVEFFAQGDGGITTNKSALVSIMFCDGPNTEGSKHAFEVTATGASCYGRTVRLTETIDKTPPNVSITFPDATTPGGMGYVFKKDSSDGNIWVQMPNCTNKNIGRLWINGTADDTSSGVNRVEIWINGTYMGDATLSIPPVSHPKSVTWSWNIDPTKDTLHPSLWKSESWYYVVAKAYDNSVNDNKTIPAHNPHPVLPLTNFKETPRHWFFWMDIATVKVKEDWVPGNGQIHVEGTTGFYPNGNVEIYLENTLYNTKILLNTVTADNYGRFQLTVNHLPEVPRKPVTEERWNITAVDIKGNKGVDNFALIPWITNEDTLTQDSSTTWQTTETGHFGDTFTVYGHGFLPSRQAKWDPYSTVYVRIVYTDVAPWTSWDARRVFNGTSQSNWEIMEWSPKLSEVVLAEVTTDANGYWKATITIPQSYGGPHAIYAYEYKIVTDLGMSGPTPYPNPPLVRSGWPEITNIGGNHDVPQAKIFDMRPTISISPATAITEQYVTITAEGLPLPKYYELSKNGTEVVTNRDWCFVLDFGPYKEWVFENKRIRNNELDFAWATETWYPFSYYSPDIADNLESPVWNGKLATVLIDFTSNELQFHIGSKYLKVPMLPAGEYEIAVYYFDKNTGDFTHNYEAKTTVTVLKDPLNAHVEVGNMHLAGEVVDVSVQVDVDGIAADATKLELALYKGETLVQTLTAKRIGTGAYVATFTCPSDIGDYAVRTSASKTYDMFTLQGSAMAGFTVNPTLTEIKAEIVSIKQDIGLLKTDIGQLKLNLSAVNAKVVAIEGKVVTIETKVGDLKTDLAAIDAVVGGFNDDVVQIYTALGRINVTLKDLNGLVTIQKDVATIQTSLGEVKGKVLSLENRTATIQTDIGTLKTDTYAISGSVGLQPVVIGLSLIAAIATIAAAILILRKIYVK